MTNDENIHTLGRKKASVCEFQVCLQMLPQSFVAIQNISSGDFQKNSESSILTLQFF